MLQLINSTINQLMKLS